MKRKTFNPTPPQQLAIRHLLNNSEAWLWLGCGLGKTAATLAAAESLIVTGEARAFLVVAPLRVANITWRAELEVWERFRHLRVVRVSTLADFVNAPRADFYVTNFDNLQHLANFLSKRKAPFDGVIFDETTRAKNHASKRINAVRKKLRECCKYFWGLTGTPAPNSYLELFAQSRLLDGGKRLGQSFHTFRQSFFRPVDYMKYDWRVTAEGKKAIEEKLKGFVLSLRSSDWLGIPDVEEKTVEIDLPDEARGEYEKLEEEFLLHLNGAEILAPNAAVLVNKLLQIASGAVYDAEKKVQFLHAAKIKELQRTVSKIEKRNGGRGILIFANYRHELDRVAATLSSPISGDAVRFDSAKNAEEQNALVENWNAGKIRFLIANPNSMGHGLNLQHGGADVVWFSLPWSREIYEQANARVARMGQKQIPTVTRLVVRGTVEEAVVEVLQRRDEEQRGLVSALKHFYAEK